MTHLWILQALDRSGLSPWLLGIGCFLTLSIAGVIMLIIVRYPDPTMYRNTIAFVAIISFFLVFYFAMGRGWYRDLLTLLEFDSRLDGLFEILRPTQKIVYAELVVAGVSALVHLRIGGAPIEYSQLFAFNLFVFFFFQYVLIVLCFDVLFRQLICMMRVVKHIRIDLLNADFYSTLANSMVRHVGLQIFGICLISFSYIIFTEGQLGWLEMMVVMMPWYLPGLVIISLYLVPYNHFRRRVRFHKHQELNCVAAALAGNYRALDHSLLKDEPQPTKIDLLYYQDRIRAVREWPFTDRIRALVLFGILPPLTWVIAALIEISIEGAL